MCYQIFCGTNNLQGESKPNAYHNCHPYIPDCTESSVINLNDSEDGKPDNRAVVNKLIVISSDNNEVVDSKHASLGKHKWVP